jgi:hypothetical protein
MVEWLRSLSSNHLPLTAVGRNFGFFHVNVGCSTQVPVRAWNNARIGTRGLHTSKARTSQNDLYCVGVT